MKSGIVAVLLGSLLWPAGMADAAGRSSQPPKKSSQAALDAEHTPPGPPAAGIPGDVVASFNEALQAGALPLDALYAAMEKYDRGAFKGVNYALTTDNSLDADFLLQTPRIWGKPANEVRDGEGIFVADHIQKLLAGAQKFVDITTLVEFPTGGFKSALVAGLKELATSGRPVTVRILGGWYPFHTGPSQEQYLKSLIAPLIDIPNSKLRIYVGIMRAPASSGGAWNHSKIIAVDGERAMTGGQNLWDHDYLRSYPAHDLSIGINGSAAFFMGAFSDFLWSSVCKYTDPTWKAVYWEAGGTGVQKGCLPSSGLKRPSGPGKLRVLGAGRLAGLADRRIDNASDVAMALALGTSQSTLRIAQQDLGVPVLGLWKPAGDAIGRAIVARQHVYIVLTSDHAKAGSGGTGYWNGLSLTKTADAIKAAAQRQPDAPPEAELNKLLCSNLHLAPIRFGPSSQWPNGFQIANHSKFFMVDDSLFYIGSSNLYPSNLQEYGVFLDDAETTRKVRQDYWDPLWTYSVAAAISGSDSPNRCYYQK